MTHIGLLRHFPVHEPLPSGWMTSAGLQAWQQRYNDAETRIGQFDVGDIAWKRCIASDLPRALATARTVFAGEIEETPLLREVSLAAFATGDLQLPVWLWQWTVRIAWLTGHRSQQAARDEFRSRVSAMGDRIAALEEDTLIVSHAGMMAYLSRELLRRGFDGPKLRMAEHAVAYVYARP